MALSRGWVLSTSGLLFCLALCDVRQRVLAQPQDAFLEAQISALQARDAKLLEPFGVGRPSVKLAAKLTMVAVSELERQARAGGMPDIVISREGASLTSHFITRGAERAVEEDPLGTRERKAESNLKQFIDQMVKSSVSARGRIDEKTYTAATSLCPLWPFC